MEHQVFRCCHCKRLKTKRTSDQCYCHDDACQKARKNTWRRRRYTADADYRANQRDSTDAWLKANGGSAAYHQAYRKRRKDASVDRGAKGPRASSQAKTGAPHDPVSNGANSDAKTKQSPVISGRYQLVPVGRANSDAIFVELSFISDSCASFTNIYPVDTGKGDRYPLRL